MSVTLQWPTALRDVWQRYHDAGYTVIISNGLVYLFHMEAPRHCLATEVDRGRWIARPAMDPFIASHLYEDMAGAIEQRLLRPWLHVSRDVRPELLLEWRQIARDCYCYQGVELCDFCTGRRSPDRNTWEDVRPEPLAELLIACGWHQTAPFHFEHADRGHAAIHGDGSGAGLPTTYYVTFYPGE